MPLLLVACLSFGPFFAFRSLLLSFFFPFAWLAEALRAELMEGIRAADPVRMRCAVNRGEVELVHLIATFQPSNGLQPNCEEHCANTLEQGQQGVFDSTTPCHIQRLSLSLPCHFCVRCITFGTLLLCKDASKAPVGADDFLKT